MCLPACPASFFLHILPCSLPRCSSALLAPGHSDWVDPSLLSLHTSAMYDTELDLDFRPQPSLPPRYDSDEEDISEPDVEYVSSPADSSKPSGRAKMNSDDFPRESLPRLLPPFNPSGKRSRPVSLKLDTVKHSSSATTFVTEPFTIFDHDDDMILELPSPDTTASLQSPMLLQPASYTPSEPLTSPRNSFRSCSSISIYSDDESDVYVAERVTYVEPHSKPNLVLITLTEQPGDQSPMRATLAHENSGDLFFSLPEIPLPPPIPEETGMHPVRPSYTARSRTHPTLSNLDTRRSLVPDMPGTPEPASAPLAEVTRPMSFRARTMSFSRPQTPMAERSRRLRKDPPSRPPSTQSIANFSIFPPQQPYAHDESRSRSISLIHSAASSEYSLSSSQPSSRTVSPSPYQAAPYNRSRAGSHYSISSTSSPTVGKCPPLPYHSSIARGSMLPGYYSSSSLRSEVETEADSAGAETSETGHGHHRSKSRHTKGLKQLKSSISKLDSGVGFMLRSKRKSVAKSPNA